MITVHHLETSRSQRVLWMLEELGLPYEIKEYKRDPKTMLAPKSLESAHPLGKSPVVEDDSVKVAESAAILEYLVETYGKGRFAPAPGSAAMRDYRYFLHYAEGSLMPYLLLKLVFKKIGSAPMPFFAKPIARQMSIKLQEIIVDPNLGRHVAFLGKHLESHTWFAGDELTAADMQMSYPIEALCARAGDVAVSPHIKRWLDAVHARPAYRRALEKGGPVLFVGSS